METAKANTHPLWKLISNRRLILIAVLTFAVAIYFWTQSRYPALDAKAAMGGDTPFSGIAFDSLIEVLPNDGRVWEITANAINWAYTNWKGMTFGVLFSACALTLLGLIERRSFRHPMANAALGAAIGAPLGVCVNCAAPIARGLHGAGMRLETTLAAMIASPTLNVVVISMSFALLPTYMAAIKLTAMLGFILVGIPLLTRFVFRSESQKTETGDLSLLERQSGRGWLASAIERIRPEPEPSVPNESWIAAAGWMVRTFLRNLVFIFIVTVPLMLVAGALGAALVTLFPFKNQYIAVAQNYGVVGSAMSLIAIAAVAILLPVPMTFDVILAIVLVNSGWPARYVVTLLIALGSFSIYSYLVVGRAISFRVASGLMASLGIIAIIGGLVASRLDVGARSAAHALNMELLASATDLPAPPPEMGRIYTHEQLAPTLAGNAIVYQPVSRPAEHHGPGEVTLALATFSASAPPAGKTIFHRMAGSEIGLDLQPFLSGLEVTEPYTMFNPIAASDINGDGWDDIAIGRDGRRGGLVLYINRSGHFVRQKLDLGDIGSAFVNAIAFVDLNQDAQPDLFVSTYLHGSHVFWNAGGSFSPASKVTLPNGDAPMIGAPAFADLDADGDLDIVAANWSIGTTGNIQNPFLLTSRDRILWNEGGGRFTPQLLQGLPGESLTSLVTDVDGDGRPDVMIGEDISTSDTVYLNKGGRKFALINKSDGLIPYLTWTTMSLDAGDYDRNGSQDLYAVQIAYKHKKEQWSIGEIYCSDDSVPDAQRAACFEHLRQRTAAYLSASSSYSRCERVTDKSLRVQCAVRSTILRAGRSGQATGCNQIPAKWPDARRMCELAAGPRVKDAAQQMIDSGYVGGVRGRNVFLRRSGEHYVDQAKQLGVALPGWGWNAKFADLDQDGWQDIYVATGFLVHRSFMPNMLYRNRGGTHFDDATVAAGLSDTVPTSSYVLLDYDRDGDLDVIRASQVGEPIVHRSDHPAGKAFWVRLADSVGNSAGVGAIVTIRTGSVTQMREIRQSGGFTSFDPPKAHFGLGSAASVDEVVVKWPDGATTRIGGGFPANGELIVRRTR